MKPIFLFNPEHDLALANGDRHYIAPRNIREMARDLAELMSITTPLYEESTLQGGASPHPIPWGWDAACTERFKRMGITTPALPTDGAIAALSRHSERGTAHRLLNAFHQSHPDSIYIGESLIVRSFDEIATYAMQHAHILLKAPLSGSGKGLRHVKTHPNPPCEGGKSSPVESTSMSTPPPSQGGTGGISSWANALIHRHGYLTAEPYYPKVLDFAMEFITDATGCHFIGYSLFATDNHGRYIGSRLTSDAEIEHTLTGYIPREVLHEVRRWVIGHHSHIVPPAWDTAQHPLPFGIDMMIVDMKQWSAISGQQAENNTPYALHPCIEINLRMNMGIVAHELYRHRLTPDATGTYQIARFADNATLRQFHEEHSQLHPATYHEGKLSSGYMLLTPITDDTLHLAYALCD
ncbi:MAG: hypothetical protein J6V12_04600 [Bacteroidaceae bacterium]|nr:hypothetical protein [Bacteroidaceae bacterium]